MNVAWLCVEGKEQKKKKTQKSWTIAESSEGLGITHKAIHTKRASKYAFLCTHGDITWKLSNKDKSFHRKPHKLVRYDHL